ncbi:hypothetical protein E4U21_004800 [Claviceps maximensis]|nr:hypothetical protein E4U21_004800 [Claviceps maximensis]
MGPCKMRMWNSSRSSLESSLTHSLTTLPTWFSPRLSASPPSPPNHPTTASRRVALAFALGLATAARSASTTWSRPREFLLRTLRLTTALATSSATTFSRCHPRRGPGSYGGQGISRLGQGQLSGLEVRIFPPLPLNPLGSPSIPRVPHDQDEDATDLDLETPSLAWPLRCLTVPYYRETAAKFQKEWHVKEPHRDFAFAPHVKGRALISVVNNGLFYYGLKRDFALKKLSSDAPSAEVDALQVGIFGPLKSEAAHKSDEAPRDEALGLGDDVEASRKRIQAQLPNGSPEKRPRLINGYADASVDAVADASINAVADASVNAVADASVNAVADANANANLPVSSSPNANANASAPASASASAPASASASAPSATSGIDYAIPAASSGDGGSTTTITPTTTTAATTAAVSVNTDNTNTEISNSDSGSNFFTNPNDKNNNHDTLPTYSFMGNSIDNNGNDNDTQIHTIHNTNTYTSNAATINTPASNPAIAPTLIPTPTPMDIDVSESHQDQASHSRPLDDDSSLQESGNNNSSHAYPSPLEGEQLPPVVMRTDGPEQGTQVDRVEELTPDTTFIRLMDKDDDGSMSEATATPSLSPAGAENAPVLLQCEWNPRDPSVLAAAGTDALARVWTISHSTDAEPGHDQDVSGSASLLYPQSTSPRAHTLLDPDAPRATTVTALSWTSDGTAIAVATDSGSAAAVNVWSADGVHMQNMEVSEPPVIKLSWNPGNTALLAISPDTGGALITIYHSSAIVTALTYHLPGHDIAATPLDATWINDTDFLLTGGDVLLHLSCSEASISQVRKFETKEDDCFTQVLYDWRSKLAATSSDKGTLDLWDESGQRRSISAHRGAITTMAWQPLLTTQPFHDEERLIATGGEDCAIVIWNGRRPESKAKCFLKMDSPIVRLAFTPDGAFIAGATSRQVLIWKVDNHTIPRASWNRPPHPAWLSPKGLSESDEEDEHCLCWDVSGQKLAYGSNSRLAVINFSR